MEIALVAFGAGSMNSHVHGAAVPDTEGLGKLDRQPSPLLRRQLRGQGYFPLAGRPRIFPFLGQLCRVPKVLARPLARAIG